MKNLLFLLLILQSYSSFSQSEMTCEEVLKMELNLESNPENLQKLMDSFVLFKNCGFDDTDVEIFSNASMIGTILIDLVSTKKEDTALTYKNLYDKILVLTENEEYKTNKPLLKISLNLAKRPADINNWEEDKHTLEKIGVTAEHLTEFHNYLKEHTDPSKTYEDVLRNFKAIQNEKNAVEVKKYDDIFTNAGNVNYNDLLKEAKELDKPLLLYFTGYACINCRKMESSTFADTSILERLKTDFHFVNLYVDDQKPLPEDEWIKSDINGKMIKKIGQKHIDLQVTKFKTNTQPFFVIIDKNGKKIATQGFTKDSEIFNTFLNMID